MERDKTRINLWCWTRTRGIDVNSYFSASTYTQVYKAKQILVYVQCV